jgi:hypothetical protein
MEIIVPERGRSRYKCAFTIMPERFNPFKEKLDRMRAIIHRTNKFVLNLGRSGASK